MINLNYSNNVNNSNQTDHPENNLEPTQNENSVSPTMSNSPVPEPPAPPLNPHCARCRFTSSISGTVASNSNLHRQSTVGSTTHLHQQAPNVNFASTGANVAAPVAAVPYTGFDANTRLIDEEEDCPTLLEHDFNRFHHTIPGLRRSGVDANAIRQHYYPDGDWGWIVCSVAFLAHILTTGFQLSYGFLLLYAIKHLGQDVALETSWLGSASWAMSLFSASIVIAMCRRKSTRLVAVIGGLVIALGILFASFATLIHQVAISYCIVIGFGASLVRDSASVMIGHYFKRRRQFVEMIVMAGEGVGIALFSVIIKEGVGKIGWRLGLQFITVLMSTSFFMGLLYRPASLYHPQRRAILHLKNSRKKVKEKKTHQQAPKQPFMDFSPLRSSTVRMLCILASIGAFGVYTPLFFLSFYGYQEGHDMQDLVLLQTFLGLSLAVGIVASGSSINKTCQVANRRKIRISRQYVCQGCVVLVSISIVIFSMLSNNYHTLCAITWIYGFGLGGYRYSLKMLALERIRGKFFTRAWGFIKGAESIPVLISIPLTGFLNDASLTQGKAGYYICSALVAVSGVLMFFIGYPKNTSKFSMNGSVLSRYNGASTDCTGSSSFRCNNPQWTGAYYPSNAPTPHHHQHYPPQYNHQFANGSMSNHRNRHNNSNGNGTLPPHGRLQKSLSFAFQTPAMMNESIRGSRQNQLNAINYPERSFSRCDIMYHSQRQYSQNTPSSSVPYANGLNSRSRSVPEGLAHPNGDVHWNYNRTIGPNFQHQQQQHSRSQSRHNVQLLEQITTSV